MKKVLGEVLAKLYWELSYLRMESEEYNRLKPIVEELAKLHRNM